MNKAPQIVDGDHVLRLGKDELIRRAIEKAAAKLPERAPLLLEVREVFKITVVEARQLCEVYGFDPYA